jgi:seryl-tRNA synthetase
LNEQTGFGTGQLPDKEGQMYQLADQQFYLIPTAEVPLTNYYRNAILAQEDFPVQMTAYTPCFRREAGSYGKDVRGLNRLHQFDKVEIVQIEHPDRSYQTLNRMISYVEGLIQELGLSYRILRLCGGDLGFAAAITYDLEVYAPAQQKWMEVSSISNFEDYQANRMQLRYRETDKKTALAHTLNGSALAFPRLLAALMEFCQTENGIQLPEPLASYAGFTVLDA